MLPVCMGENYTTRSSLISDLIGCLKYGGKGLGMWFECAQPFLPGERCLIFRKKPAKETRTYRVR